MSTTFGDLPFELRVNIFSLAARLTFGKTWLPKVHAIILRSQARWEWVRSRGQLSYRQIVVSDSPSHRATLRVSVNVRTSGVFYWYELISEGLIWREVMTTKRRRKRKMKKKVWVLRRERNRTGINSFYKNGVWRNVDMSYRVIL
jgi:hypothetical protein